MNKTKKKSVVFTIIALNYISEFLLCQLADLFPEIMEISKGVEQEFGTENNKCWMAPKQPWDKTTILTIKEPN